MRKIWKRLVLCLCMPAVIWGITLILQKQLLQKELIRFHVVANSDTPQDQEVKLRVRDAVLKYLREDLQQLNNAEEAKIYLTETLPFIQSVAKETLESAGFFDSVTVSLCREEFDIREYDTFTLPSGVYESLRIVIGEGQGHNWWCVTFPNFCMPAVSEDFEDVAAGAGFSEKLIQTLGDKETYEIRFYLLDVLGRLENILHTSE